MLRTVLTWVPIVFVAHFIAIMSWPAYSHFTDRLFLEFIVLGRIPGTEFRIVYDHILVFVTGIVWVWGSWKLYKWSSSNLFEREATKKAEEESAETEVLEHSH